MAGPHLVHAGSPAQLERWLPKITRGECITAVAVTEPDAGSDVAAIRTRARFVQDSAGDGYVIDGAKMFITNGVHADLVFVAARTGNSADPAAKGSRGISIFAVERGTPGFRVGRALKKQGWLASDTAELVFEGCRVPAANRLGEENAGFYAIMKNFQVERIALGSDGGRPLPDRARSHLAVRHDAARLRRTAVGQADDPPTAVDARRARRRGPPAAVPLRLARRCRTAMRCARSRCSRR